MSFSIKQIFQEAYSTLESRGKTYDPEIGQERSMEKITEAFNIMTGHELSIADGWLFMQILKEVRQQTSPEFHRDSMIDKLSYVLLEAEERMKYELTDSYQDEIQIEPIKSIGGDEEDIHYDCSEFTVMNDGSYVINSLAFFNQICGSPYYRDLITLKNPSPEQVKDLLSKAFQGIEK